MTTDSDAQQLLGSRTVAGHRPAPAADLLDAVDHIEALLDRHEAPAVQGKTRYVVSDANWFSAQLRLAAARRRASRELSLADANALVSVLELRADIDPAHIADARELAASVGRCTPPTE